MGLFLFHEEKNSCNSSTEIATSVMDENINSSDEEAEDEEEDIFLKIGKKRNKAPSLVVEHSKMDENADSVAREWLQDMTYVDINWSDYIFDEFKSGEVEIQDVMDLYFYIDSLKWYRKIGSNKYPSIVILARISLCRSDSSSYQESVFSSGAGAMDIHQTKMSHEHFEKRTLLYHNESFIDQHNIF